MKTYIVLIEYGDYDDRETAVHHVCNDPKEAAIKGLEALKHPSTNYSQIEVWHKGKRIKEIDQCHFKSIAGIKK